MGLRPYFFVENREQRTEYRVQRKLRVSECREKVYFYYAEREQLGRSQQSKEQR